MKSDMYTNVSSLIQKDIILPKNVIIDDTTLREGEQTPGTVFSLKDKLKIAKELAEVGVKRIESGFPAASKGERKAVSAIVREDLQADVFGFARAVKSDIDAVVDCGCYGVILSFPPSDIHLKHKLRISREQYLERLIECVEYAKSHGLYVTFSAEDSTRTDPDFLKTVFQKGVKHGVDCMRVVDTLGVCIPTQMKHIISVVKDTTPAEIEVHCHNDHGLAVANSIAAFEAGATVLSTSVNGLGERAGIAATEEVMIVLHNLYGIKKFHLGSLFELCKLVEDISRVKIAPNKPVCGSNVFVHTSGIHQDAVLKSPITYEPYPPELIGRKRRLILGKLSGFHAVKAKLTEMGIDANDKKVRELTMTMKEVSESRRSSLSDEQFKEIVKKVVKK